MTDEELEAPSTAELAAFRARRVRRTMLGCGAVCLAAGVFLGVPAFAMALRWWGLR